MDVTAVKKLRTVTDFPALIDYLRDEMDWPIEVDDVDQLTFEYSPEELGIDPQFAARIESIRQVRPLVDGQPWGIFYIQFETRRLPITVMRRILNRLVTKQRSRKADQATWNLDDLLFISAVGSEQSVQREMTFAHFHQESGDLPTLRVLGWDGGDTALKIEYVAQMLKEKLRWPANPMDAAAWRELWSAAFRHKPGHVIRTAEALAGRLAELARSIRDAAQTLMAHETEKGHLRRLHKAFQTALIHDLSEADFADTYAQTITYGLLTAAISRTEMSSGVYGTALVAENVTDMVPVTNPFLREMLETFLHAGGRQGGIDFDELGIQDVVELLRGEETDLPAILRDFGNRTQGEDPVIHFYEHFLSAYNKQLKVQRGVFYTPRPVVSYIVRSVHELLQTEFGLADGLADTATWGEMEARLPGLARPATAAPEDPFVMILDPATGTATFLVEVIDVIHKTLTAKWEKAHLSKAEQQAAWNEYVPRHLLPRLHGYELMMAPYAIAHMKIGLKLYETGYRFQSEERARVYLTNALEEPSPLAEQSAANLFEALGHEAQAVNEVKRKGCFTVMIGNPPYSNYGMMNKGEWILGLLNVYKKGLNEKKLNLDDDFIKFIRFAQWQIDQSQQGILAFITNNTFSDGLTHRRMRESLIESFDQIYILNLHGNSKKQEVTPERTKDENVFDIQQGVSIGIFIKSRENQSKNRVCYSDLWGERQIKYESLLLKSCTSLEWQIITPINPHFFFVPKDFSYEKEYKANHSLTTIFLEFQNGIKTDRDELFVDFDFDILAQRMNSFYLPEGQSQEFITKYNIIASTSFDIVGRRNATSYDIKNIRRFLYRPFDLRWLYYNPQLTSRPALEIMRHILSGKNIGIITTRQTSDKWGLLATVNICGHKSCAAYDINSLFPLYLYSTKTDHQGSLFDTAYGLRIDERRLNLSRQVLSEVEQKIGLKFILDGLSRL